MCTCCETEPCRTKGVPEAFFHFGGEVTRRAGKSMATRISMMKGGGRTVVVSPEPSSVFGGYTEAGCKRIGDRGLEGVQSEKA